MSHAHLYPRSVKVDPFGGWRPTRLGHPELLSASSVPLDVQEGLSAVVDEQPIDIHQYSRAIRAALPRIVAFAVVAAAIAVAFSLAHPSKPSYAASTTILARDALDSTQGTSSTSISQRLATVNLLTTTTRVLSLAAGELPGTSVDELRSAVRSSVDPAAAVITITADASTPAAAAARANAVAERARHERAANRGAIVDGCATQRARRTGPAQGERR